MSWLIALAAGLLTIVAIGTVIWTVYQGQGRSHQRLAAISADTAAEPLARPSGHLSIRSADLAPVISSILRRTAMWERLQLEILRAGWLLRPSELVSMIVGAGLVGALAVMVVSHNWFSGIMAMVIAAAIPWVALKMFQSRRAKALSAQIPDALDMLTSALRSGFAFLRGLQLIQTQMHPPIAQEIGRVVEEVQFGTALADALDNLVMRTNDYDMELIVAAVQTQLEVGGNLAEVLDNIAGMVRERVKLSGELAAATGEGRLSAGILLGMPFAIGIMVSILNPGYMKPLFTTPLGLMLIAAGMFLMLTGAIIINRLIQIDI